jgi:hypothetical protein
VRANYRGREVDLRSGPALAAATAAGVLLGAPGRVGAGAAIAVAAAGAAGTYDDLCGQDGVKGLRGHLGSLARGRPTTGVVKIAVIGGGALVGAVVAGAGRGRAGARGVAVGARGVARIAAEAALVAGAANLVNLFDLRPGRALKACALPACALLAAGGEGARIAAAAAGAGLAAAPGDLAERTMLGDAGAGALGAALGCAAARRLTAPGKALALVVIGGLTLVSEKVSFSGVIARTGWLERIDQWGRRA